MNTYIKIHSFTYYSNKITHNPSYTEGIFIIDYSSWVRENGAIRIVKL